MPASYASLALRALRIGRTAVPILMVLLLAARSASAEKLSKEDKQWLGGVEVLILPDEEKVYKDLAAEDRAEFRNLFWARRNPRGAAAATNPARDEFEKAQAEANRRFGRYGTDTDCAQMFLLLGEPDTERAMARPIVGGPGGSGTQDTVVRQWVYRRATRAYLASGDLAIGFDESCRMNDAARRTIRASLQQVLAKARVTDRRIEIRLDETGRLVPLARQLPQAGPAQALLLSPRQDFPMADEVVFMRSASGDAALLGLLHGHLDGATPPGPLKVTVRAETVSPKGEVAAYTERDVTVRTAADGSFDAAFGLLSPPGTYTLRAGALALGAQRGAAVSHTVDVPDFAVRGLTSSTLMFLENVVPASGAASDDPLEPFVMGPYRLVPRVGRTFARNETVLVLCNYYGGQADAATGNASVSGSLGIFKDGQLVAKRTEQTLDAADGTLAYGPLSLESFSPGRYEAEILITDKSSKQETKARGTFEIKP